MDPGLNPIGEAALDKAFELASRLTDVMQQRLGDRGLTAARAEVLLALQERGPMVQRRLSDSLRCTPRNVTGLVDGLEAQGLVERGPHPTDRRATVVSLTKRGEAAAARMGSERQQAAQWLLGEVPSADLATFVAVADHLLGRIEAAESGGVRPSQPEGGAARDSGHPRH